MAESTLKFVETRQLKIGYLDEGAAGKPLCLLVHGWPDDALTWSRVVDELAPRRVRCVRPYLRGFGPTKFLDTAAPRSGQLVAMAIDLIEFIEALDLRDFVLVGHDWGARISYMVAARLGDRLRGLLCLSVGYGTNSPGQQLSFDQARLYWYHWYFATDRGRQALRSDPEAFTRQLWRQWSPSLTLDPAEWRATARSFDNPDWVDVTIDSYRHRWGLSDGDPSLDADEAYFATSPMIAVPAIVIHGADDGATLPSMSEGKERFFASTYARHVLPGAGHFVQREDAGSVVDAVTTLLR